MAKVNKKIKDSLSRPVQYAGQDYTSFEAAIEEANKTTGNKIFYLMEDYKLKEQFSLSDNIILNLNYHSLDLNGCNMISRKIIGNSGSIIDTGEIKGSLYDTSLSLNTKDMKYPMFPLMITQTGVSDKQYQWYWIKDQQSYKIDEENDIIKLLYRPSIENNTEYNKLIFANGIEDNEFSLYVTLQFSKDKENWDWNKEEWTICSSDLIADIYSAEGALKVLLFSITSLSTIISLGYKYAKGGYKLVANSGMEVEFWGDILELPEIEVATFDLNNNIDKLEAFMGSGEAPSAWS